ncbi:MAG: hypothetical protein C4326_00240 [Ignavibacteria bacterium]
MKLRRTITEITDAEEREAQEAVGRLAGTSPTHHHEGPSETYFANLIVRTNERIDRASSGLAISLSWLARVAVPGVVAIIFFFIGLHYYGPERSTPSVVEMIGTLTPPALDSLLLASQADPAVAATLQRSLFDVSADQLVEFYIATENPTTVLETLPEQQVKDIAAILEARAVNL